MGPWTLIIYSDFERAPKSDQGINALPCRCTPTKRIPSWTLDKSNSNSDNSKNSYVTSNNVKNKGSRIDDSDDTNDLNGDHDNSRNDYKADGNKE